MKIFKNLSNSCRAAWIIALAHFYSVDHMVLSHEEPVSAYIRERRRPVPLFFVLTLFFLSGVFILPEIADYLVEASYGEDALFVSAFLENKLVDYLLILLPGLFALLCFILQILHRRNFKEFQKYFLVEIIGRKYAGHS